MSLFRIKWYNYAKCHNDRYLNNCVILNIFIIFKIVENFSTRHGGAMYVYKGTIEIEDSIFEKNDGIAGGAIYVYRTDGFTLKTTEIAKNSAVWGAGIYFLGGLEGNIIETNFESNKASRSGGAINQKTYAEVNYYDCKFISNEATMYGSCFLLEYSSTYYAENTEYSKNVAKYGLIGSINYGKSEVILKSCVISDNNVGSVDDSVVVYEEDPGTSDISINED